MPLLRSIVACLAPLFAWIFAHFSFGANWANSRTLDLLIAIILTIGAYCGVSAVRNRAAGIPARTLGFIGALICVPYAAFIFIVAIIGLA